MASSKTVLISRAGGRFITLPNRQKIFVPKGSRLSKVKLSFPQGNGTRLLYRKNKDVRRSSDLVRIKQRQMRAERKAGVRVGNGLFDNPLSVDPQVIGVVRVERRKQQNPSSGKKIFARQGGKGKGTRGKSGSDKLLDDFRKRYNLKN